MATQVINTVVNSTGSGTVLTSGENLLVTATGALISNATAPNTGGVYSNDGGHAITIRGDVLAPDTTGISLRTIGSGIDGNNDIVIAAGATVNAGGTGIFVEGGNSRIAIDGSVVGGQNGVSNSFIGGGIVVNVGVSGSVTASSTGISVTSNALVQNAGTVAGGSRGMFGEGNVEAHNAGTISGGAVGVDFWNSNNYLVNSGAISGDVAGVRIDDVNPAADNAIVNTGSISANGSSGAALDLQAFGTFVHNTGSLSAEGDGVFSNGGGLQLVNAGAIAGAVTGVELSGASPNTIVNLDGGTITGLSGANFAGVGRTAIRASNDGADQITNQGHIDGDVDLRGGDDSYDGSQGSIFGTVYGRAGNDTIVGGADDDTFVGGADNDTLRGMAGRDTLYGESGSDNIAGGDGDDFVFGQAGIDTLRGGDGDDVLSGGSEAGEADYFYFEGDWDLDTVIDFQAGTDRLVFDAQEVNPQGGVGRAYYGGGTDVTVFSVGDDQVYVNGNVSFADVVFV